MALPYLLKSKVKNLPLPKIISEKTPVFQELANQVKPSIVVIESVDRIGREGGRGTGFVVSSDGLIATNFHVIGEHRSFQVRFANGDSYQLYQYRRHRSCP